MDRRKHQPHHWGRSKEIAILDEGDPHLQPTCSQWSCKENGKGLQYHGTGSSTSVQSNWSACIAETYWQNPIGGMRKFFFITHMGYII